MSRDLAVIERYVGRINTDIRSGWEVGLQGMRRVGGQLFDRHPPEHLAGQRRADWKDGKAAAARFLESRKTHFSYQTVEGRVEFWRKGFADRARVVKSLRDKGIFVDIDVCYVEDGEIVRRYCCGY